jgi:hypothetical protein
VPEATPDDHLIALNSLTKLFTVTQVWIPERVIPHWVPAVTQTVSRYYGSNGATTVYSGSIASGNQNSSTIFYFMWLDLEAPPGTNTVYWIKILGIETHTETIAGHYIYEVIPAHYETSTTIHKGWDASARSIDFIASDGTAQFSVNKDAIGVVVGLNNTGNSYGSGYTEIGFGIYPGRLLII